MISPILLFDFYLSLSPVVYSSEDRHLAKHRIFRNFTRRNADRSENAVNSFK